MPSSDLTTSTLGPAAATDSLINPHTGQTIYQCPYCSVELPESQYNEHVEIHKTDKPHCCPYCPFRASHRHKIRLHLRTHTGEKPYACHLCPASFSVKCNLKTHIRTHTGEKPFKCPHCFYRCADKSAMNRHVTSHKF